MSDDTLSVLGFIFAIAIVAAGGFCGGQCYDEHHVKDAEAAVGQLKVDHAKDLQACKERALVQIKRDEYSKVCMETCKATAAVVATASEDPKDWKCGCAPQELKQ